MCVALCQEYFLLIRFALTPYYRLSVRCDGETIQFLVLVTKKNTVIFYNFVLLSSGFCNTHYFIICPVSVVPVIFILLRCQRTRHVINECLLSF